MKITTECKTCLFNIKDSDVQIGCRLNRLDKFENKEFVENNYVIQRFCNGYRPQVWADDINEIVPVHDIDTLVDIAREEMILPINYVISFNEDIETLKKTLVSISKINNFHPRSRLVVINRKVEYNEEIYDLITNSVFNKSKVFLIFLFENVEELDQAAKNFVGGVVAYVKSGYEFPQNFHDKIYKYINEDMKIVHYVYDETKTMFFAGVFKTMGGNLAKMNIDGTIDKRNFYQRIMDHNKGIYSWGEFFDADA